MTLHVASSNTIKAKKTKEREELETLYQKVRDIREGKSVPENVESIFVSVKNNHPNDWLLSVEICEILQKENNQNLLPNVIEHLNQLKNNRTEVAHLIEAGLELIFEKQLFKNNPINKIPRTHIVLL